MEQKEEKKEAPKEIGYLAAEGSEALTVFQTTLLDIESRTRDAQTLKRIEACKNIITNVIAFMEAVKRAWVLIKGVYDNKSSLEVAKEAFNVLNLNDGSWTVYIKNAQSRELAVAIKTFMETLLTHWAQQASKKKIIFKEIPSIELFGRGINETAVYKIIRVVVKQIESSIAFYDYLHARKKFSKEEAEISRTIKNLSSQINLIDSKTDFDSITGTRNTILSLFNQIMPLPSNILPGHADFGMHEHDFSEAHINLKKEAIDKLKAEYGKQIINNEKIALAPDKKVFFIQEKIENNVEVVTVFYFEKNPEYPYGGNAAQDESLKDKEPILVKNINFEEKNKADFIEAVRKGDDARAISLLEYKLPNIHENYAFLKINDEAVAPTSFFARDFRSADGLARDFNEKVIELGQLDQVIQINGMKWSDEKKEVIKKNLEITRQEIKTYIKEKSGFFNYSELTQEKINLLGELGEIVGGIEINWPSENNFLELFDKKYVSLKTEFETLCTLSKDIEKLSEGDKRKQAWEERKNQLFQDLKTWIEDKNIIKQLEEKCNDLLLDVNDKDEIKKEIKNVKNFLKKKAISWEDEKIGNLRERERGLHSFFVMTLKHIEDCIAPPLPLFLFNALKKVKNIATRHSEFVQANGSSLGDTGDIIQHCYAYLLEALSEVKCKDCFSLKKMLFELDISTKAYQKAHNWKKENGFLRDEIKTQVLALPELDVQNKKNNNDKNNQKTLVSNLLPVSADAPGINKRDNEFPMVQLDNLDQGKASNLQGTLKPESNSSENNSSENNKTQEESQVDQFSLNRKNNNAVSTDWRVDDIPEDENEEKSLLNKKGNHREDKSSEKNNGPLLLGYVSFSLDIKEGVNVPTFLDDPEEDFGKNDISSRRMYELFPEKSYTQNDSNEEERKTIEWMEWIEKRKKQRKEEIAEINDIETMKWINEQKEKRKEIEHLTKEQERKEAREAKKRARSQEFEEKKETPPTESEPVKHYIIPESTKEEKSIKSASLRKITCPEKIQAIIEPLRLLINSPLDPSENCFTSHIFKSKKYTDAIENIRYFLSEEDQPDLKQLAFAYYNIQGLLQKYEFSIKFLLPQEGYDYLKKIQKTVSLVYFNLDMLQNTQEVLLPLTRILKAIQVLGNNCESIGMDQIKGKLNQLVVSKPLEPTDLQDLGENILDNLSAVQQAQLLYDISCTATERLRKGSYSLKTFFGRDHRVDQAYRLLDKICLMCKHPRYYFLMFNHAGLEALAEKLEKLNASSSYTHPSVK